jgi:PKD repeat protein
MSKGLFFILMAFSLLIFSSCGKEPTADFTWEPKVPKAGQEVKFTNLSLDANSYSWNFGDMSIGSDTNPIHIYKNKGSYIIDLSAHNGLKSNEKTVTITITD